MPAIGETAVAATVGGRGPIVGVTVGATVRRGGRSSSLCSESAVGLEAGVTVGIGAVGASVGGVAGAGKGVAVLMTSEIAVGIIAVELSGLTIPDDAHPAITNRTIKWLHSRQVLSNRLIGV